MLDFSKRFLFVAALSALSFGLMACDDDSSSDQSEDETCSGSAAMCDGNVYKTCVNGKFSKFKCTDMGADYLCDLTNHKGCYDPNAKCQAGTVSCDADGTTVTYCDANGQSQIIRCSDQQMICDLSAESTTHCKYECDSAKDKNYCLNATTNRVCGSDHRWKDENCTGTSNACSAGSCVSLSPEEICLRNGYAYDSSTQDCVVEDSIVGTACSCTDNCTITITGAEIKAAVNPLLIIAASDLFSRIQDTDTVTAPNYFPGRENISGCEDLVVPEGMSLGCFYDATISFPQSVIDLIKDIPTLSFSGMSVAEYIPAEMAALFTDLANQLKPGIPFKAPNGYCLTATIDIGNKADVRLIGISAFAQDPLGSNGLINKINTGDHAKVVAKSEAEFSAKRNYCPTGSVFFSYDVKKKTQKIVTSEDMGGATVVTVDADVNVGFDMCLKACKADTDCLTGYKCVDIPDGVPSEGQTVESLPTKKACFDMENITYFTNMTDKFEGFMDLLDKE